MSAELKTDALVGTVTAHQLHAAAVHVADRVAAKHPHELDELMPRLVGRQLAQDPAVRDELLLLLDAIGYSTKEQQQ